MSRDRQTTRAAFALPDLLGLLAALAVAASLALAAARQMRQESMNASSLSQLRWMAGVTLSYAADNDDRLWGFSWQAGDTGSSWPDLRFAHDDKVAASHQAVDILRRRGRLDIPTITEWVPHVRYSHLPLLDYLDRDMPDFHFVAPGDTHRVAWARDPEAFDAGAFLPFQPDPVPHFRRWPYSSSYEQAAALFDRGEHGVNRISQGSTHATWLTPESPQLGAPYISDVRYAAAKVHTYDAHQRELGGPGRVFLDPSARVPVLMFDGAAGVRHTEDANSGWQSRIPRAATPMWFTYSPRSWESPEPADPHVIGRYRWTRGGIEGRDFGGPEIDTGQL